MGPGTPEPPPIGRSPTRSDGPLLAFPYPRYLWTVVRRGAVIWLLLRLVHLALLLVAAVFFGLLTPAAALADARDPGWTTRAMLVGLTAALVWWDRRRSGELLLQADLATSTLWFWTSSVAASVVLDVTVQALLTP